MDAQDLLKKMTLEEKAAFLLTNNQMHEIPCSYSALICIYWKHVPSDTHCYT